MSDFSPSDGKFNESVTEHSRQKILVFGYKKIRSTTGTQISKRIALGERITFTTCKIFVQ